MLRITIHEDPSVLTLQLEGALVGPWLRELQECCRTTRADAGKRTVRVDLTGVTFISDAAKATLADLHRQGAEFVAADCLTRAIVAEIDGTASARDAPESVGVRKKTDSEG